MNSGLKDVSRAVINILLCIVNPNKYSIYTRLFSPHKTSHETDVHEKTHYLGSD